MSSSAESVERRCSFCGKSQRQVRKIISGPKVCICDGCVGVCNEVLAEDEGGAPAGAARGHARREFHLPQVPDDLRPAM